MSTWSEQRIAEITVGKPWFQLTEMEQKSVQALLRVTDAEIVYRIIDRMKKNLADEKEFKVRNTLTEIKQGNKKFDLLELQKNL